MNINDVTRQHLNLALRYCQETFGYSKYHAKPPKVVLDVETKRKGWGLFDPNTNTLTLYLHKHKYYIDVLDTFIHEYTHHMQNHGRPWTSYAKKYTYDKNPHELEAAQKGLEHRWLAKAYIRNYLKAKGQI